MSFISRVPMGSRPLVGSSSRISSGSLISAWARPMRRVMPLEYSWSCRLRALSRPTSLISESTRCSRDVGRHVEQPAVEVERLLGRQKPVQVRLFRQIAEPLVLARRRWPACRRPGPRPRWGTAGPSSSLIVVVLPEPLGPSRPNTSPRWTSRSRAFRARTFCRPQKSRYTFVRARVWRTISSLIGRVSARREKETSKNGRRASARRVTRQRRSPAPPHHVGTKLGAGRVRTQRKNGASQPAADSLQVNCRV